MYPCPNQRRQNASNRTLNCMILSSNPKRWTNLTDLTVERMGPSAGTLLMPRNYCYNFKACISLLIPTERGLSIKLSSDLRTHDNITWFIVVFIAQKGFLESLPRSQLWWRLLRALWGDNLKAGEMKFVQLRVSTTPSCEWSSCAVTCCGRCEALIVAWKLKCPVLHFDRGKMGKITWCSSTSMHCICMTANPEIQVLYNTTSHILDLISSR